MNGLVVEGFQRTCYTEEEFEQTLGEILSSEEVTKALSILLAQIRSDLLEQVSSET